MAPGMLIASPQMRDPNFEKTVVLLCHHDEEGALGLVINRATTLTIGDVMRQLEVQPSDLGREREVLWGGPVEEGAGFVVFRGGLDAHKGWDFDEVLSVSTSREALEAAIVGESAFHLCLGYAGWGPGQLDHEIETGSWLYIDVDADICLDLPMDERYRMAMGRLGLRPEQVWMKPIDE